MEWDQLRREAGPGFAARCRGPASSEGPAVLLLIPGADLEERMPGRFCMTSPSDVVSIAVPGQYRAVSGPVEHFATRLQGIGQITKYPPRAADISHLHPLRHPSERMERASTFVEGYAPASTTGSSSAWRGPGSDGRYGAPAGRARAFSTMAAGSVCRCGPDNNAQYATTAGRAVRAPLARRIRPGHRPADAGRHPQAASRFCNACRSRLHCNDRIPSSFYRESRDVFSAGAFND